MVHGTGKGNGNGEDMVDRRAEAGETSKGEVLFVLRGF